MSEGPNWTTKTPIYLFKNGVDGFNAGEKVTVYGKDYWRWQIDSTNGNKEFAFTYVNDWNNSGGINANDYYRTELAGKSSSSAGISFSAAGGKVFARDTEASGMIGERKVYIVKDITEEITNKIMPLSFYDFTEKVSSVRVSYSSNSSFSEATTESVVMNGVTDFSHLFTVELEKAKIEASPYVKFTDESGKQPGEQLGDIYYFGQDSTNAGTDVVPVTYKAGSADTFLYGATELKNDGGKITTISGWGTTPGNDSLKDEILYFDNQHFPVDAKEGSQKVTLQIGSETERELKPDPKFKDSLYSYTFTEDTTQQTVLTVKDPKGNIYHFFWTDRGCNLLQVTKNIANVTGEYGTGKKIYFDATYSKLNTPDGGNGGQNSIPASDDAKVYFCAWNETTNEYRRGEMIKAKSHEKDGQTWDNVWYVRIPEDKEIDKIIFSADALENKDSWSGDFCGRRTAILTIPDADKCGGKPCFYADAGDTAVYEDQYRGGYWAEAYTVRDAEKYKKTDAGKNVDVVDIKDSDFSADSKTLYVDSTFYDYYTDYELNGNNRDSYPGENGMSHRNWVTFRQFDQALSDYYKKNRVSIPIYTGHFQPSIDKWGCQFNSDNIGSTLKLYGSENYNNFFSTNNSAIDADGWQVDYSCAAQGLVSATLSNGTLMTANGESAEPHFDEAFLLGKNSKNAVLGEVYHNVSFPFKREVLDESDGVEYWCFDSSETTLAMQKDPSTGEYYLKDTGKRDWAKNVGSDGKGNGGAYGFFPFNEDTTAESGKNYNYGFGTKLEIKFRLTENGTVKGNNNEDVPITFEFAGDDDVWVFIDGKLALDVGGDHGRVDGTLNFAENKATVSAVKKSAADATVTPRKTTDFTLEGDRLAEHTLTMFYMERGMWESNMKITFNFPDDNEFAVEKQVDKSEVNELFKDSFEDASVFPFTIQNQATHFGKTEAGSGTTVVTKPFNSFDSSSPELKPASTDNTFERLETYQDQNGVAHWYALVEDTTGEHKDSRFGIIPYQSGETLDAFAANKYLDFKLYYDDDDTPTAKCIYLELEDAKGNTIGDLLSGKLYGNTTLKKNAWNTLTVDLSKLKGSPDFDYRHIRFIKFNYSYPRNIYLDDFVFRSGVQVTKHIGFKVNQEAIPDYGSAKSGNLEKPEGAVYSLSDSSSTDTGVIGEDGTFVLADGQTATFRNQFRRGSYISVKEEIDSPAFETSWSLYENGHIVDKVTKTENIKTVEIPSEQKVSNVREKQIKDGRKEVFTDENKNTGYTSTHFAKEASVETENAIVFRSYDNPDNESGVTKLKAVFVNKVNVGSLKIKKERTKDSDELKGTYAFQVKFTNVAGMPLEKGESITTTFTLKEGRSHTISGIPIGTDYEIIEEKPIDGTSLKEVLINNKKASSFNAKKGSVNGTITAETDMTKNPVVVFRNNNKPTGNIAVTKQWVTDGTPITDLKQLPKSIYLQLQRKEKDTANANWKAVDYSGNISPEKNWVVVTPKYSGSSYVWSYSFMNLEQYVNSAADPKVRWIYRVMEVDANGTGKVIDPDGTYTVGGKTYRVTYSMNTSTGTATNLTETGIELADPDFATTDGNQPTANMTVTNTYLEKLNLKITKEGKNTTDGLLSGVVFKLEKEDKTGERFEQVGSPQTTVDGIVTFEELGQGPYRLTETKAAAGYNLLSNSILIRIDTSNAVQWKMENETENETEGGWTPITPEVSPQGEKIIPLTIYNTKQLVLPATGGSGGGLVTMGGIALMAQAILMGTYFTLQCRKGDDKLRKKR